MKERTFGKKKCVWCGKEFIARSPRQNSCGDDHYRPCAICGEPLLIKESYQNYMKYGPRVCPKCKGKKISQSRKSKTDSEKKAIRDKTISTNIERYGVDNPMKNKDIKAKADSTVKEKYGVDNLSQSKCIQEKIRKNSLDKYGVDHYSKDPSIRQHMIDGMVSKYGVEYAAQSEELLKKIENTNLEKYGVKNILSSKQIQDKIKKTCLDKYGYEHAASVPEIIDRRKKTNLEKYGAPGYVFSSEFLKLQMTDPSKYEKCEQFRKDPRSYILNNYEESPTYAQLSDDLGICDTSVGYHICKNGCQDVIRFVRSNMENEVVEFILSFYSGKVVRDDRSVISPKEIDIYLPQLKLGFECNPTVTHNSDKGCFSDDDYVSYSYHKMKTDMCEDKGVRLIHLFGYDWTNHKSIIKSMIVNSIGLISNRYYARKLTMKEVSWKEASAFLIENHRQGYTMSKVRIGLYDKDELISLMTFGKLRGTQGKVKDEDSWELSRFCSKINCSVVGGASKLFKYFIDNYRPNSVVSFSDRATTSGKLYEKLGFIEVRRSDPGYVWVNLKDDSYVNRVNCQKRNIRKLFNDDTIDIENKSEAQIMKEHGYVRVYDSGLIRWKYRR